MLREYGNRHATSPACNRPHRWDLIWARTILPKPFNPRELLARIKSVLRRTSSAGRAEIGAGRVRIGRCVLDFAAHRLTEENGTEVPMSPLEYDLLKAFAEHPNQALSRERILSLSQQRDWDPFDRGVDLRIMRLRKKIEPDPEHPQYIKLFAMRLHLHAGRR